MFAVDIAMKISPQLLHCKYATCMSVLCYVPIDDESFGVYVSSTDNKFLLFAISHSSFLFLRQEGAYEVGATTFSLILYHCKVVTSLVLVSHFLLLAFPHPAMVYRAIGLVRYWCWRRPLLLFLLLWRLGGRWAAACPIWSPRGVEVPTFFFPNQEPAPPPSPHRI